MHDYTISAHGSHMQHRNQTLNEIANMKAFAAVTAALGLSQITLQLLCPVRGDSGFMIYTAFNSSCKMILNPSQGNTRPSYY